jgi:hypothetical protein
LLSIARDLGFKSHLSALLLCLKTSNELLDLG